MVDVRGGSRPSADSLLKDSCLRRTPSRGGTSTPTTRASSPLSERSVSSLSSCSEKSDLFSSSASGLPPRRGAVALEELPPAVAHTFAEPRSLSQLVADIAHCIDDLELKDIAKKQPLRRSQSSSQLSSSRHMAGSPSQALRQQRDLSRSSSRPQSAKELQQRASLSTKVHAGVRQHSTGSRVAKGRSLKAVFTSFAAGRERMYWRDFEELCRCSLLFDGLFMVPDARQVFDESLSSGQRSIDFDRFEQLLREVAFTRQCDIETVQRLVSKCVKCRQRG